MDHSKQMESDDIEEEILEEVLDDFNDSDVDSENIPIFINNENKDRFIAEKDEEDEHFDDEMLESLEDIGKHFFANENKEESQKESSPDGDVIFINDKKVSINSLKKIKDSSLSDTVNNKAALDDITEESDQESDHHHMVMAVNLTSSAAAKSVTEKGSMLRNVLKNCLPEQQQQQQQFDERSSIVDKDQDQISMPHISIRTTSTEYKTINEYLNSTLFDEHEYSDHESLIKNLKNQLQESKQEQTKLISEIENLKSKIDGDVCNKNATDVDEFSKKMENLKKSLPVEITSSANFNDYWNKFEKLIKGEFENQNSKYHKTILTKQSEVNKLKQLLKSIASNSQCINELTRQTGSDINHAKSLKNLRIYFESMKDHDENESSSDVEQEEDDVINLDDNSEFSNNNNQKYEDVKKEVISDIQNRIQTLLSGNFEDDSCWPAELLLLREKLTAANQLEIAQLKIKHEEEMSRIRNEYDIELQRKIKRHAAFDENRDLEKIISERDNLRDLSASLRFTLCELAKCINQYESDLNTSYRDDEKDEFNISTVSINTKRFVTFKPDVTNLIAVVEDPQLLNFVSKNTKDVKENSLQINIVDCLNRLKSEANNILELSEKINKQSMQTSSLAIEQSNEKADSCEEEDGLKTHFFQSLEPFKEDASNVEVKNFTSLPINFDKNVRSDAQKSAADTENDKTSSDNFNESYLEDLSSIKSPSHKHKKSLSDIKNKAKELLSTSTILNSSFDAYQIIEDFCRETDNFIDNENQQRLDLQKQLEVADKQIKSNKRFLEEQAAERDQERDEFVKELEQLKVILKEREKDKISVENYERKIVNYEEQIKNLTGQLQNLTIEKQKYEQDLKDSIDKVFDLREIISNLEGQIQSKIQNENDLMERVENLENHIGSQTDEDEIFNTKENEYVTKISMLEDELKLMKPSNEQKMLLQQMTSQLKMIENILDRKTKTLEAFHALSSTCSTTACSSPSEDVSRGYELDISEKSPVKLLKTSNDGNSLPLEEISRILEKFSKHNRLEEATTKKVIDLEMTLNVMKNNYSELQQEKDILDERISEQLLKISSLQNGLDDQRIQAEELSKQNNSDLTLRVHDLENELTSLKEILATRDKQISNLNQLLEHSKTIIERQDHELAIGSDKSSYDRLNEEIKNRDKEINSLKEKIKTEMINKAVIPDLMETMIAEKDEEIDNLKEKISQISMGFKDKQNFIESAFHTNNSEFDEPEVLRRAAVIEHQIPMVLTDNTVKSSQFALSTISENSCDIFTDRATIHTSQDQSQKMVPSYLIPRQINFNSTVENSAHSDAKKINNELQQTCVEIEELKLSVEEQSREITNLQHLLETKEKLYDEIKSERNSYEEKSQMLTQKILSYENELKKKDEELGEIKMKIQDLEFAHNQDIEQLRSALNDKDEMNHKLSEDLMCLQNKCKENESILVDLDNLRKQVSSYNNLVTEKDTVMRKMEVDLLNYVKNEQLLLNKAEKYEKLLDLNKQLEIDADSLRKELCAKAFSLEKYKIDLDEMEKQIQSLRNDGLSMNHHQQEGEEIMTIIDIASKLDRELNYAAELDNNIVEAIKSESEMSSELDEIGSKKSDQVKKELNNVKFELDHYKEKYKAILNELDDERKYFNDIHQQDANLIESMNLRLKLALDNESTFKKMLESEKLKNVTLSHLTGLQRTKSFDNNLLFKESNIEFDPSSLFNKKSSYDFDSELVHRLRNEIQFLTSQKDGEKDRVLDLECVLERERDRFKKTLVEQQIYIDQLKKEIQLQLNSNQNLKMELDERRNNELVRKSNQQAVHMPDIEHLEEQNHYLIGRFMRSESFRKALIFQKKFLLITLSTKIGISTSSLYKIDTKKRKTFRSIALLVIAIERFKFIAKRWTGKRIFSQTSNFSLPKRSQSASNNQWVKGNVRTMINNSPTSQPQSQPKITQSKQSQLMRIQNLFHDN